MGRKSDIDVDHESTALTPMQQKFVYEYLVDLNGTKAVIRSGYSPATAKQKAVELLKNQKILDAISDEKARRINRTFVSADKVISELARLAFVDITDIVSWGRAEKGKKGEKVGEWIRIIPSAELPKDVSAAISEIKQVVDKSGKVTTTVKLYSKPDALKTLAKHLGIGIDRNDGSAKDITKADDAALYNIILAVAKSQGLEIEVPPPVQPQIIDDDKDGDSEIDTIFADLDGKFDVEEASESAMLYGEDETEFNEDMVEGGGSLDEPPLMVKKVSPDVDPRPNFVSEISHRLKNR